MRRLTTAVALALPLIAACTPIRDANTAHTAQASLLGFSEVDLETCLGVPLRRSTSGSTTFLTYEQTSSGPGGINLTLPVIGGVSFTSTGNCRANIRLDHNRVTSVRYTGETDTDFAQDSYCAPLVRTCVRHPLVYAPEQPGGAPIPAERRVFMPAEPVSPPQTGTP